MRVLVAEDEALLSRQLAAALGEAGYAVDRAADGETADFLGRTERFDAVVLDLGLPKIDGLTVLRGWRDAGLSMPVLVLTARGSWHEKVQGIDGGADDYMAKPFRMEEVLARLRALIRRASGQVRSGAAERRSHPRPADGEGLPRRKPGEADEPRIPGAVVPHAPPRARRFAGRADGAHLRAGLRPRLEHGRGVHRPLETEARAGCHRNSARLRVPDRGRLVTPMRSLRSRLLVGGLLWMIAVLLVAHFAAISLIHEHSGRQIRVAAHFGLLALLALGFIAIGVSLLRKGLTPFRQLRERLSAVRAGRDPRVEGSYPTEVQPLVNDLNALLEDREQRVARAVAKAGDLAHGLKTPLQVLSQEAERAAAEGHSELAETIGQQVERMRRQIDYHLAHARAAASGAAGARCPVAESAEGLSRTLLRLHAGRGLSIDVHVSPEHTVRTQREDLDEMLGNLLDNACKWAKSRVTVTSSEIEAGVVITVDDDGPGLDPSMRDRVLQRGVRADEAAPGLRPGPRDRPRPGGALRRIDLAGQLADGGVRARLQLPAF